MVGWAKMGRRVGNRWSEDLDFVEMGLKILLSGLERALILWM